MAGWDVVVAVCLTIFVGYTTAADGLLDKWFLKIRKKRLKEGINEAQSHIRNNRAMLKKMGVE